MGKAAPVKPKAIPAKPKAAPVKPKAAPAKPKTAPAKLRIAPRIAKAKLAPPKPALSKKKNKGIGQVPSKPFRSEIGVWVDRAKKNSGDAERFLCSIYSIEEKTEPPDPTWI